MARSIIIFVFYCILTTSSLSLADGVDIFRTAYHTPPILVDHGFAYSLYVNLEYDVDFDLTFPIFDPNTSFSGAVWAVKRVEDSTLWEFDDYWRDGLTNWEVDTSTGLIHYSSPPFPLEDDILLGGQPGTYVLRFGKVVGLPVPLNHYQYWHNMDSIGFFGVDTVRWDAGLPHIKEISIVQPCARNWLPVIEGYIDETGHPNYDDFKVTLSAKFATQTPPRSYKFRWVLQNISWYDGVCMNNEPDSTSLPDSLESNEGGGPTNPDKWWLADLMILGRYNPNYSCWYDTNRCAFYGETNHAVNNDTEFSIVVSSYDFGAHGDILLEAQADSASPWYNLTKYQRRDSVWATYSTIPIDEDNPLYNKCGIADYWKTGMLNYVLCPDTITSISQITPIQDLDLFYPGQPCELGDYLNVFEEYRGFYCKGIHNRTNIWGKDFFVFTNFAKRGNFFTGIGYAQNLGPGLCHLIDSTEMKEYFVPHPADTLTLEMNLRKSVNWLAARIDSHQVSTSVIFLNNSYFELSDPWPLGCAVRDTIPNYLIPKETRVCYMFYKQIRLEDPVVNDPDYIEASVDSLWQLYIAGHEIGHTVNMYHNLHDSTSIMHNHLDRTLYFNPPSEYLNEDLNWYLVKPLITP